ncbi:MAG: PIN domain-containing protein [Bryobacterales bacterium]|nr:PIN domain-containing protein [Bryobacterales bacterium]
MQSIDTDVLVRLIVRDDAQQVAAAEQFIQDGAWVPILALAETAWVLKAVYQIPPSRLYTAVVMLLDHERLTLQHADAVALAAELFHAHPGVGFTDCLMAALAIRSGHTPLATFDGKLARLDGVVALTAR